MIQEHKRRFLKVFVAKMEKNGTDPQELVKAVSNLEGDIRESYSEDLGLDPETLVEMMVLDGCFILTLFMVVSREVDPTNNDDPIFTVPWVLPSIRADLLLLENQEASKIRYRLKEASKITILQSSVVRQENPRVNHHSMMLDLPASFSQPRIFIFGESNSN
ncbi:unnamed protein product [Arabidopsis halleri]